jgi:hypothetical protein
MQNAKPQQFPSNCNHGLNDMADRSQIEAEFGILIHENQDFQRKSTRGALI